MFCPKCGTSLPENSEFCSNCGTSLKEFKTQQVLPETNPIKENNSTNSTETMTEMFSKKSKNFINPILDKIKQFCLKYKKPIAIGLACCFILSLGILLFNKLYDFTKIGWDMDNGDANVTHTQPTTLTLNVLAYDKKHNPIYDIEFSTEDGEIVSEGAKVDWILPEETGNYTITARAPSGKKISKSVKVVKIEETETYISGVVSEPVDDEVTDSDEDGLMNAEEKELGTNIYSADSDADGLPDKLEIEETKTDPLRKDSDGDGINDGDELDLDLDPLKVDSKGDGVKDGNRTLTYSIEQSNLGISMEITGKGNIASSTIDLIENSTFSNMEGVLSTVYNFYTEGTLDSAIVKIEYDEEDLIKKGLDEENLTFYYFNEETKQLEEIPTEVNIENKTLTVTLKHFSKYVIGDRDVVLTDTSSQIMFLIDNSISMYSQSQMDEAGHYYSTGAIGNDTEFKRLSLTNKMIDMFTGNYKFGVAEFAGTYVNLSKFTNDTALVKNAVNSMQSKWKSSLNGTNIIEALNKGIDEFSQDEDNHYIILLTDGQNSEGSMSASRNTIIENAKEKNIKVCVIGLGSNIDTDDLNMIAESTGCDYYNAIDSSALDEIYSLVGADINYSFVDTDKDSKTDGMIMADSGFIVTRDGFSFDNFISSRSEGGHCYGMATFAMLYYTKELPLSLDKAHKWTIFKRFPESNGYDLTNTFISRGQNLYDYKFTDEGLKLFFNPLPSDYRDRVEDRTWLIKKEYYDILNKIGSIFSINDYNGEDFDKYQSALLNIDNETFNNAVVKDESQLLDAIYRLFILQVDDKSTPFGSSPDKAFKELNEKLNDGIPVVVAVAGNHAINAIRLIQDNNNSNQFKIEVYDNNYPGETRYINVTRNKYSKFALNYTAWTNTYNYTFTYDAGNDGTAEELSVDLRYPIVE